MSGSRQRRGLLALVASAAIAVVIGGTALAAPAFAADTGALTVNKTVDQAQSGTYAPGDEFTYQIAVGCDDNDCANSVMTDPLPAAFAGFQIVSTTTSPTSNPSTQSYAGCTTTVTADCTLTVAYREALGAGAVGISAGDTYTTSITLKVPADLPPTWPSNGQAVTNTASATSTTATSAQDTADVTVTIPVTVGTTLGKTWAPSTQQFSPGSASTVTLTPANTSNVPADSLVTQDPTSAVGGQSALGSDNPFALVDFTGFGPVTLPDGATTVQVDAYVYNDALQAYEWVPGQPNAPGDIALPAGVDATAVAGLRFTFAGASGGAITAAGAAGSVAVQVAQRATNRQTGADLVAGGSVTNQATSTVTVAGHDPATATASAPYTITPLSVAVTATKSISPGKIPAGTTATATVGAKNTSNGPLDSLSLADTSYFTRSIAFGGFSAGIAYPSGATAGTVTWHFSDGSTSLVAFADGTTPSTPAPPAGAYVSGFELSFTGAVAVNATASAQYLIAPAADTVAQADTSVQTTNEVDVTGTNAAGPSTAAVTAPLQIFYPTISVGLSKSISPQAPVSPGGTVVAQLPATTDPSTAFVSPDTIVVTDAARAGANDFWNSFDPTAIAPTQVPRGSTMLAEYSTDGGATWQTLTTADATAGTIVFRYDIPADLRGTITGLRYTFSNPAGFAQGVTVSPNTVYQARSELRDGSGPTSVADAGPSTYQNEASALGTGAVTGLPDLTSPTVTADANAQIQSFTGQGTLLATKQWTDTGFARDVTTLDSQSGEQAGTKLGWGVNATGYSSLTVTDSASDPGDPASTVFQAFDLRRIAPLTTTSDPLMQWDQVSQVELYENGAWTSIAPPTGSWMNAAGFTGYTLSSAQIAATTGVRITVTPNDAARSASNDPLAPPAGSGIATSAGNAPRFFGLVWQLRNVVRSSTGGSDWVTASHGYNSIDPGTIDNTVAVAGVQNGDDVGPRTADDTISLIDQPPLVSVAKTTQKSSIVVPQPGDVPQAGYPTNDFTVKVQNDSASRASYLRATDPMPCDPGDTAACKTDASSWAADPYASATYSPATNPFERFTITGIAFSGITASQVSTSASTVTLWHRAADGTLSTTQLSVAQAAALTAAQLSDVVGVSALYQGASPTTTGGTITDTAVIAMTLHTQVRTTLRSDPATFVTPFSVDNYAFAQSYDPVLFASGAQSTPTDVSHASVALTQGRLDVTASKSFSPTSLLEKNRATPVAVTLGATQGPNASVAASQVTISDVDQGFWSSFQLTGLSASDVTLPAGSDEVRVDVQTDGSPTWQLGTFAPTATLPPVDLSTVSGIRFVFERADHGLLSNTAPPATWSAQAVVHVAIRDDLRGTTTPVPFPSTVSDTIQTGSHRYADSDLYPDAASAATASFFLDPGTFQLDVAKDPQGDVHTVAVGDTIPWTMRFTNTGTGFLTIWNLVDTLPASLEWDGNAPTYSDSSGGLLSTTGVTTSYDADASTLTFAWPSAAERMAPGESFAVTLGLILQPGLTGGQHATNQMVVTTAQTLASCTNTSGNNQGIVPSLPATECGTTNYVSPQPGPALFTTKGVQGDVTDPLVSGAVNPTSPSTPCVNDRQGYYRSPCVANTRVGGTDEWRLAAANSGTVPYRTLTMVDPLPVPGDRLLATGSSRGSTYRPVFDATFGMDITAPAGTTITWQVTTTPSPCVGTGATSAWNADPTCSTAAWVDSAAYAGDGSDVTGLRVLLDFSTTATGQLAPGGRVQALFRTVNDPVTAQDPGLAPVSAPVTNEYAWNQFGAVATSTTRVAIAPRAPVKAGVTLAGGPLTVTKTIIGPAAAAAPTSFEADVSCTVGGRPVDLGALATLTLDAADGYTATIPGIPLGATCTTTEAGDTGSYGEASRSVADGTVRILAPAAPDGSTPDGQTTTLTNSYEYGHLSLDKVADAKAVQVGKPISYDITVTNTGGLEATDFSVSDELPTGATFISADLGGTLADGVVTWPIADLAPGDSTVVTITVVYDTVGAETNHATIDPPAGLTPFAPTTVVDPCPATTGQACSSVAVTLNPPGSGSGGRGGSGSGHGPGSGGSEPGTALSGALAFTGSNPGWLAAGGAALLLTGAFIVGIQRRRRRNAGV